MRPAAINAAASPTSSIRKRSAALSTRSNMVPPCLLNYWMIYSQHAPRPPALFRFLRLLLGYVLNVLSASEIAHIFWGIERGRFESTAVAGGGRRQARPYARA